MPMTEEEQDREYRLGLERTKLFGPHVIQRRRHEDGEWKNIHLDDSGNMNIRGYEAAERLLEQLKKSNPKYRYRILSRNEADIYRNGVNEGRRLAEREMKSMMNDDSGEFDRLPKGMYLPDNL